MSGFFGSKTKLKGQKRRSCEVSGKYFARTLLVSDDGKPILGKQVCFSLNLVQRNDTLVKDSSVFEGTGCMQGAPVKRKLTGVTPHCVHAPRRIPLPVHPKLRAELNQMEKQGIFSRITEPAEWCASIVIAPKKNGNIRVCVDLQMLNRAVAREQFSIPILEEVLGKIGSTPEEHDVRLRHVLGILQGAGLQGCG